MNTKFPLVLFLNLSLCLPLQVEQALQAASAKSGSQEGLDQLKAAKGNLDTIRGLLVRACVVIVNERKRIGVLM